MTITNEQIENWFTYHPPTPEQQKKYDRITEWTRRAAVMVRDTDPAACAAIDDLSDVIVEVCPPGGERLWALGMLNKARERDGQSERAVHGALADLRAARMWANAAIACAPGETGPEPEPDEDDPRTEDLARVRTWPAQDTHGLLDFVASIWRYDNHVWREGDTWHVATGGWSGNEAIIDAMQANVGWWALAWRESKRGGDYVFRPISAPEPQPAPRAVPETRARVDQMTPAELAIREAALAVEAMPADPRLTDAVNLLHEASAKVYAYALEHEMRTIECVVLGQPWVAPVTNAETFASLRARALREINIGVRDPDNEIEIFDQRGRRCEPGDVVGDAVTRVYFSAPVGMQGYGGRAMSDRSTGPLDAAEWAITFDPNYVPPPRMSDEERAERIARLTERWLRKRALVDATARNLEDARERETGDSK